MLDTGIGYVKPGHMQRLFRKPGSLAQVNHGPGRTVRPGIRYLAKRGATKSCYGIINVAGQSK